MTGSFYLNELHKEAKAELEEQVKQAEKALHQVQRLITRIAGIDAARGQLRDLNHWVAVGPPDDMGQLAEMLKDKVCRKHRDLALDREDITLTCLFGRAAEMREQINQFADKTETDWSPDDPMYGWTTDARVAAMALEDDYWPEALNQFNKILYECVSHYYQEMKNDDKSK